MGLAEGIRKHGFRKWYERELLQSHAHLVLAFLSLIGIFAGFEVFDRRAPWDDQLRIAVAILLSVAIGAWALRRYLRLLMHAEATANQAECPHCKAYGQFTLASENMAAEEVTVRCRRCAHGWTIIG
jgi:predicted Zn finger-like uncharacterized protein